MRKATIIFMAVLLLMVVSFTVNAVTEISFMWWSEDSPEMDQLVEEFEKENPGITVKYEVVPFEEVHDKLVTQIAGGMSPDVVFLDSPWVVDFAARGALTDLTTYIESSNVVKPSEYTKALMDAGKYEGKVYGVPYDSEIMGLFYRKDLFEEVGLNPDNPPATWDEFLNAAKALTRDTDNDGRIDRYGFLLLGENPYWFYPWVWQAGAELTNEAGTVPLMHSKEGIEALKFFTDLHLVHKVAHPEFITSNSWDGRLAFENGQVAMMTAGAWLINVLREEIPSLEGKWSTAPLPSYREAATTIAGDLLAIPKGTKHVDEAWKFIEFLSRPDNLLFWNKNATMIPPLVPLAENPENFVDTPLLKGFAEGVGAAHQGTAHPKWGEVQDVFGYELQKVLYGEQTAEEAMNTVAKKAAEILVD